MIRAVLIFLMLLPLLGAVPGQSGQSGPSAWHEPDVGLDPPLVAVSEQPAGPKHADTSADETRLWHPEALSEADRAAQRARAIEKRDPALLPVCTDEELTNRPDPEPAKSFDPWEYPEQLGCRLPPPRPDQIVLGPPSEPGPAGAGITQEEFEGRSR